MIKNIKIMQEAGTVLLEKGTDTKPELGYLPDNGILGARAWFLRLPRLAPTVNLQISLICRKPQSVAPFPGVLYLPLA